MIRNIRTTAGVMAAAVCMAHSGAMADVIKSFTYTNKTGTAADDFHLQFNSVVKNTTMANRHSNEIQNAAGARTGSFRTMTSSAVGGGAGAHRVMDYTTPRNDAAMPAPITVGNNERVKVQVHFTGNKAGAPTSGYFTLGGVRIDGRIEQVGLLEDFTQDPTTGFCRLDIRGGESSLATASNLRLWTGLGLDQALNFESLSAGDAMSLGSIDISGGGMHSFDLGAQSSDAYAVLAYDLSYWDADLMQNVPAGSVAFAAPIPAPGAALLLALGSGLVGWRRRR